MTDPSLPLTIDTIGSQPPQPQSQPPPHHSQPHPHHHHQPPPPYPPYSNLAPFDGEALTLERATLAEFTARVNNSNNVSNLNNMNANIMNGHVSGGNNNNNNHHLGTPILSQPLGTGKWLTRDSDRSSLLTSAAPIGGTHANNANAANPLLPHQPQQQPAHAHLLLRGADSGISLQSSLFREGGGLGGGGGGGGAGGSAGGVSGGGMASSASSSGHMTGSGSGALSRGSATPQTSSSVGQMTPIANDDASTGEFTRSVSAGSHKGAAAGGGGGGGGKSPGSAVTPGREDAVSAGADFAGGGRRTPKSPAVNRRSLSGELGVRISYDYLRI